MPLNSTKPEQTAQAASELAKKLKLEVRMKRELREFFSIMAVDFAALYALTGSILNAGIYVDDLRGIVSRQYRRTARAFIGSIITFLREAEKEEDSKEEIILLLLLIARSRATTVRQIIDEIEQTTRVRLAAFIAQRVIFDVINITRTNQKVLEDSIVTSKQILTDKLERIPTRQEVAALASRRFRKVSIGRSGTIAATTTQGGAEGTKQIERDSFLEVRNDLSVRELGVAPMEPKEIWVTQGDNLVRTGKFNHLSADFQEKKEGVFTVSNEKLKFPGDRSLGASAGNVINCRCSAVTVIDEEADIPVAVQVQEIQDNTDFGPETVSVDVTGN